MAEFGQYVSLNHGNSNNGFITLYKVYYIVISINYSYTVYYNVVYLKVDELAAVYYTVSITLQCAYSGEIDIL